MRRLQVALASFLIVLAGVVVARSQSSDPAAPRRIVFAFEGNRVFSDEELRGITDKFLLPHPASVTNQDLREWSDFYLRKLTTVLRSRGYLRATVTESGSRETESGLEVIAAVEEGARYRLGEVSMSGAEFFPQEQLLELLEVKPGEIADGDKLAMWAYERMRNEYHDAGYIRYEPEIEPTFHDPADAASEGSVDFKVQIYEGDRFRIRRIEFVGNAHTADKVVRRALVIREGEFFSRRLLEKSIERLNGLGLFEKLDSERDVDYRTPDESSGARAGKENAYVDLTFRVKEIEK